MKRILLLFCMLPSLFSAQELYDEHQFADVLLSSRSRAQPSMRMDALPDATLDSTHVYEDWAGDFLISKYTYQFDGAHIMKRYMTGYSHDKKLYLVKTSYAYEPRKYFWIEQIDSIFEFNRYTSRSKYTRTYNEEAYLTDYREYHSNYDSPWGDAVQIYSAVEFNEKNMPVLFMDTTYAIIENELTTTPVIRKWEIKYNNNTIEEMTSYTEVSDLVSPDGWIPEIKYKIHYDEFGTTRTMTVLGMENMEWTYKFGEVITTFDGRDNKKTYQRKDDKGEIVASLRFEQFYDETSTYNKKITGQEPEIILDGSSRLLTINLKEAQNGSVTIVNASGHIVTGRNIHNPISQISLANLQSGFYIISIQTTGHRISQKIMLK